MKSLLANLRRDLDELSKTVTQPTVSFKQVVQAYKGIIDKLESYLSVKRGATLVFSNKKRKEMERALLQLFNQIDSFGTGLPRLLYRSKVSSHVFLDDGAKLLAEKLLEHLTLFQTHPKGKTAKFLLKTYDKDLAEAKKTLDDRLWRYDNNQKQNKKRKQLDPIIEALSVLKHKLNTISALSEKDLVTLIKTTWSSFKKAMGEIEALPYQVAYYQDESDTGLVYLPIGKACWQEVTEFFLALENSNLALPAEIQKEIKSYQQQKNILEQQCAWQEKIITQARTVLFKLGDFVVKKRPNIQLMKKNKAAAGQATEQVDIANSLIGKLTKQIVKLERSHEFIGEGTKTIFLQVAGELRDEVVAVSLKFIALSNATKNGFMLYTQGIGKILSEAKNSFADLAAETTAALANIPTYSNH